MTATHEQMTLGDLAGKYREFSVPAIMSMFHGPPLPAGRITGA